jgi:tetratricopeptide (TPR) repeat protein
MEDLRGSVVGDRYTIEREVGRGGMATVWLAHDSAQNRPVAIKTLHPDLAGAVATDRFLRELRLTAKLHHPNIVEICDSGSRVRADGRTEPWFAMAYLEGESLRAKLARERHLPIPDALRIADAVGSALAAAHREHVIHRDIKPENIFLAGECVYVVDFGIAKALGAEGERLTSTGLAVGTPAYMSPEQSAAEPVDERTDQYSLATVLYEMLVGEPPFTGPTVQAVITRRLSEPARPLTTVRSTIPEAVERATLRALERTPADRFSDIESFLAALRTTDGTTSPRRVRHAGRRRLAVGTSLAIAVIALIAWFNVARHPSRLHLVDPDVVALYRSGVAAFERRTPASSNEAIGALREAVRRDSLYAGAWNALAKTYARAHLRAYQVPGMSRDSLVLAANDAVNRSLRLDSMNADAWLTRGLLLAQIDPVDVEPARESIARSIRVDPSSAEAWHYLALYHAQSGDFDSAMDAWRESVRRSPRYLEGVAFLTLGHYWRRDFDSAAFWADSAYKLEATYLLARANRGYVAIEHGDPALAESSFEAAIRLSTEIERVHQYAGLALAQARANKRAEARRNLSQAESLLRAYTPLPSHPPVYIAQVYAALGDRSRAIQELQRFRPLNHSHFQLHLRCDPPFAPLHQDARFRALLTKPLPAPGKGC